MELFHQIQIISAKIKATVNLDMLKNDDEYVALVSKHLSKDLMWRWWESDKSGWTNFYLFLESIAKTAKKQLTSESIMFSLSGEGKNPNFPHVTNLIQESVTSRGMQPLSVKIMTRNAQSVTKTHTSIRPEMNRKPYLRE